MLISPHLPPSYMHQRNDSSLLLIIIIHRQDGSPCLPHLKPYMNWDFWSIMAQRGDTFKKIQQITIKDWRFEQIRIIARATRLLTFPTVGPIPPTISNLYLRRREKRSFLISTKFYCRLKRMQTGFLARTEGNCYEQIIYW